MRVVSDIDFEALFRLLTRRYGEVSPEALTKVLCPLYIEMSSLDKSIIKIHGQTHYRASFTVELTESNQEVLVVGRTGKFIPVAHLHGEPWREIAKGRIIDIQDGQAIGEVYLGSSPKANLQSALDLLSPEDILEVDQYGAAANVLSALTESMLATVLKSRGYVVKRMPEDKAKHLGVYANYDFEVSQSNVMKKVEVKSLWGTDTRYARLIHSTGRDYPTSSCKFDTQDIFAVSLFLRTGNISDFAFARSVPADQFTYGLPRSSKYLDHVNQNPLCNIGAGVWFSSIDDVWNLA